MSDCKVLIPEAIVVVPVVNWLSMSSFNSTTLNFVNLGIGFPVKVSLAAFNFWLNLEL